MVTHLTVTEQTDHTAERVKLHTAGLLQVSHRVIIKSKTHGAHSEKTRGHQFLILHGNDTIVSHLRIPDEPGSGLSPHGFMSCPLNTFMEEPLLILCSLLSGEKK